MKEITLFKRGTAKTLIPLFTERLHGGFESPAADEYSKHFNTLECNAVFYSLPRPDLIRKWK